MNLDTLISPDAVISDNEIKSKKRALEVLAEKLADETSKNISNEFVRSDSEQPDEPVDSLTIFQLLTEREKLGSTGMGHGVALPHIRTELAEQAIGAFLKLDCGIDFDSPDEQETDLIFALMVPEHYTDEHLKILSTLAILFNDENFCQQLRSAHDCQDIYEKLIHWQPVSKVS